MALPTPTPGPIPNGPFYSPVTYGLSTPSGALVVGSGLSISLNGVISATGGGGGGGSGTVTSVATGVGLTGGPITTSGTVSLATVPTVVPGSYTLPALSVDSYGRITSISSGTAVTSVTATSPLTRTGAANSPVIGIPLASTTVVGATQLTSALNSSSSSLALTAAAGQSLQNQINALSVGGNLTLGGSFNPATGLIANATNDAIALGMNSGGPLIAPSAVTDNTFFIATAAAASYTPPGSAQILNIIPGDYILGSSGVWTILRVGYAGAGYATTTSAGNICISTPALVAAGTDNLTAITPFLLGLCYLPKSSITGKGSLITGTASGTPTALPVGLNGYVLTADSTCAQGIKWAPATGGGTGSVTCVGTTGALTGGPITSTGVLDLATTGVTAGTYPRATITVDACGRITAAAAGGTSVSAVTAGTGLTGGTITSSGTIAIANTTVTAGSYSNATFTVNAQGQITAASSGGTPVTCVQTGAGLVGGPITSTGTIALANSGVTAGSYTTANITVDAYGRVTAAANGAGGGGGSVTNVATGTGLVGGPITTAGTIALANTAVTAGCYTNPTICVDAQGRLTFAVDGTSPGSVTCVCTGTGLTGGPITGVGTVSLADTTVTPGSYTLASITVDQQGRITSASSGSAGGTGTVTCVGTGAGLTGGPVTTSGTIALTTTGVTPGSYTNSSFTVDAYGRLSAASSGGSPLLCSAYASKGDILLGTSTPATPTALALGTTGQVLVVNTACAGGVQWCALPVGSGTVTSVTAGTGLCGGPITTTGSLCLTNTGVTAGTYPNACIVIDAQGRITAASSSAAAVTSVSGTSPITITGTASAPIVNVAAGSTSGVGVVQLTDNTTTNSASTALTAAQGYSLQQQINTLTISSNLTLAGTINASTGLLVSVTADGSGAGFTVGNPLPAAAIGNTDYFVLVTTPGTFTPPGGSPTAATQGDWFLSNGAAWNYLDVGPVTTSASTTTAGIVELATVAETQTGTSTALAVTPAGAAGTYIPCSLICAQQGAIISGTAGGITCTTVGGNNCVLFACSACPSGITWALPPQGTVTSVAAGTGLCGGPITTSGTLCLTNTGVTPGSYSTASFTVDAQGRITNASSGTAITCLCTGTGLTGGPITSTGTVALANTAVTPGSYTYASLTVDAQGRLTAASSGAAPIPCSAFGTKGQVLVGTGSGTFVALPPGPDGCALTTCSACPAGVLWGAGGGGGGGNYDYMPLGAVQMFAQQSIPTGWLYADGSAISRTTYADLFAVIGTTYGSGDGSTTFNIPDLRGQFLRAWNNGPTGIDGGRVFGSTQGSCFGAHSHALTDPGHSHTVNDPTHNHGITDPAHTHDICFSAAGNCGGNYGIAANQAGDPRCSQNQTVIGATTGITVNGNATGITINGNVTGITVNSCGGSETRPTNVAMLPCIKAVYAGVMPTASGVTPGTYTFANVTVDVYGRVTGATCGVFPVATNATCGVVTLCDALNSACNQNCGVAATPFAIANALTCTVLKSNFTAKGDLVIGTSANNITALPVGTAGQVLTVDASCPGGVKWASVGSGGGIGTVCCVQTGAGLVGGPITTTGTISLGTTSVTPGTYAYPTLTVDAYGRLTAASANTPVTSVTAGTGLSGGTITSTGTIALANTAVTAGSYTLANITVNAQGQITSAANGTAVTCVCTGTGLTGGPISTTGTIALSNTTVTPGSYSNACITVDAQGRLVAASNGTAAIPCACVTGKGALITGTAAGAVSALPVGTDNFILIADSSCPNGIKWANNNANIASCFTAKGDILVGTGPSAYSALGVGADGCVLATCAACPNGVAWTPATGNYDYLAVGAVQMFAMQSIPTGWLYADGSPVSRTTYAQLFAAIGTVYGAGDGSTTFNLPDLRGQFLRAWNNGPTGTDGGRAFGSTQGSCFGAHSHGITDPTHNHGITDPTHNHGVTDPGHTHNICFSAAGNCGTNYGIAANQAGSPSCSQNQAVIGAQTGVTINGNATGITVNGNATGITVNSCGGTETRPTNVAMLPCIKATYAGVMPTASGVTPGTYCFSTFTVDVYGRITGASNGVCASPTVSGTLQGCTNNAQFNTMLGCNAGVATTTSATCNVAVGYCALCSNAAGDCNTTVGFGSMSLATGTCNTAIGIRAASNLTTGASNVAIGADVQLPSATASCQLIIGSGTAFCWLTGCSSGAIRPSAGIMDCAGNTGNNGQFLVSNGANAICWTSGIRDCTGSTGTAGQYLTSNGSNALVWYSLPVTPVATPIVQGLVFGCTASGSNNTALGQFAGASLAGNVQATAIGQCALNKLTSGSANTALGACAAFNATTASGVVAIGVNAGCSVTTGAVNIVAIGNNALANTTSAGTSQIAIGTNAGANSCGFDNVLLGVNAGVGGAGSSLRQSVAIGSTALNSATNAYANVAIGHFTLACNTTGSGNIAIGCCAGAANVTGNNFVAIGCEAGFSDVTGGGAVYLGTGAGHNVTGNINSVMIGFNAGYNFTGPGCCNTVVGACALNNATGASPNTTNENTGMGFKSLCALVNGNNNTAIGAFAGCDLTSGNFNIFLGHQASVGGDNSNKIRIGGGPTTYCAFVFAPSWNYSSDIRHKAIDPAGVPYGMDLINKIEPIAFQMCNPETQEIPHDTHYYGFSAQQVAEVEEELGINVFVDKDSNPDCWSLETNSFLPVMMNALKELQAEIESLKEEIKTLKG